VATLDSSFQAFVQAVCLGDEAGALAVLTRDPALALARAGEGATRAVSTEFFLKALTHSLYAGDSLLHVAAAAHRPRLVKALLAAGAEVGAKNRRGAAALHYAADGSPTSDAAAQAATIAALLEGGAEPDAVDSGGVTALHRAVRNRCAEAVRALIDGGADVRRPNGRGTTALQLASMTTGKSGSGSAAAKAQQARIVELLEARGG
jgi:hypothetical protein